MPGLEIGFFVRGGESGLGASWSKMKSCQTRIDYKVLHDGGNIFARRSLERVEERDEEKNEEAWNGEDGD